MPIIEIGSREARRTPALSALATPTTGADNPGIVLAGRHPLVMLNLRAGNDPAFHDHARSKLGFELPPALKSAGNGANGEALWLAPGEWLLVASLPTDWSEQMDLGTGTLTDVSHGRVVIRVSGLSARDALAKGCMLDLHERAFPPRMCAQTSIAKINVIIHRPAEPGEFDLYAPRSYAGSFWHWLTDSAAEYGYRIAGGCPN